MADPAPAAPAPQQSRARLWALGIAVALGVFFVLVNSEQVKINFIIGSTRTSLIFALALSLLLGVIIGYLAALFRSRPHD